MPVVIDSLIRDVIRDDGLTRGLGDEEARMLVEWLADWGELLGEAARSEAEAQEFIRRLARRARAIARFVKLWCEPKSRGAAMQLLGVERFSWPLPSDQGIDPADLMQGILRWESDHRLG
jgi:hypothetical protein